jgi:hypothetical protein
MPIYIDFDLNLSYIFKVCSQDYLKYPKQKVSFFLAQEAQVNPHYWKRF